LELVVQISFIELHISSLNKRHRYLLRNSTLWLQWYGTADSGKSSLTV